MSTVGLIASTLDVAPDSWRDHLQPVRNITATLDFSDSTPDEGRKRWQVPLIGVFQQVAFADADHGGILDISNCKRYYREIFPSLSNGVSYRVFETDIDASSGLSPRP